MLELWLEHLTRVRFKSWLDLSFHFSMIEYTEKHNPYLALSLSLSLSLSCTHLPPYRSKGHYVIPASWYHSCLLHPEVCLNCCHEVPAQQATQST